MIIRTLGLVFGLFVLFGCKKSESSTEDIQDQETLTESTAVNTLTFKDLEGNQVQLDDFNGKKVILHYWATWCKPCIEELPALARVEPKLEDENYVLLLVSEHSVDEIQAFKEKKNFDFEYIRYEGALSELNIYALPTTIIYNEKGDKVEELSGRMDWDSEQLFNQLTALR